MANYEAWTRLGGCLTGVRCGVWHLTWLLAHWCRVWAFFFHIFALTRLDLRQLGFYLRWAGLIWPESSRIGWIELFRPTTETAEIGLEFEIGFEWGPNNLNLSFLNFILNIFLLLLCFLFCFMFFAFFFLCFVNQGIVMCFLRIF